MKRYLGLLVMLLLLAGLACGPSGVLPTIPSDAMATAVAVREQAATVAAVAAEQGGAALATIQASGMPDLSNLPELDGLRERLANIQPDGAGVYTVTITEAEISQALLAKQRADEAAGVTSSGQNTSIRLTDGQIIYGADVQQPVAARLVISFRPIVINSALMLEVTQASFGNVEAPAILLQTIQTQLGTALNGALRGLPENLRLEGIVINEGSMTITAVWR